MDFFAEYFKYVGQSEAPAIYHRWCALSTLSSTIGREVFLPFGHKPMYPNQYILLMGAPGARKSSAIGISRELLSKAGYKTFAKDRSSKERFFSDMVKKLDIDEEDFDLEALVLDAPSEMTISNGEFLDFIGQGDMAFLTALTNLWDNLNIYEHPKMHGKDVVIYKPTLNILGGATVKGLGMAIPCEALGTGILSRLLMIHSEPTGKKIAFPDSIAADASDQIVETLMRIRKDIRGELDRTKEASTLLEKMYVNSPGLEDTRFADYTGRRFTHLLKLTMLITISDNRTTISSEDALKANTILHAAEIRMPKALGEFGKSKFSDVTNAIMDSLNQTHKPLTHAELWKIISKDISDIRDLGIIMKNLLSSEKVQVMTIGGKQGYMPLHKEHREWQKGLLLEDYLTEGE